MRVAGDGEHVAVVGRDEDQGVAGIRHLVGFLHRLGQFDGVEQGALGVAGVVGVVDAAGLDVQEEAFVVLLQHADRLFGHLGQRGLAGRRRVAIRLVLHV
ncbi:MAG: hypothetical protein FD118_3705 [Rhodocyclaceae bacterium]|nr:MAG: hypothetical protein FD118_3705 [Rhodocyclaceae bacterium]